MSQPAVPWLPLSIAGGAALFVGMGLGRFSYTPMVPALVTEGVLSAAEAGTVAACNLAGFLAGVWLSTKLSRRFGEATCLRWAVGVSFLCLAASIAPWGFVWLAAWRGLVGIAVGVIMVLALAVVTRHAPFGRLGVAAALTFSGVGMAILTTAVLVPRLLEISLFATWTGLAVLGAVGFAAALWGLRGHDGHPAMSSPQHIPAELAGKVRLLMAAQICFVLGLIPHTVYWIDYLVRGLGSDMDTGGLHWALFGFGAIAGTYFWGRLADWIGFGPGLVLVFLSLAIATALPVLETTVWALVASSLVVGAQPGCSTLLSGRAHQIVGPSTMPLVWRRMTMAAAISQACVGYIMVALFEWTGSYTPVFLIGGAAFAIGALISLGLQPGRSER